MDAPSSHASCAFRPERAADWKLDLTSAKEIRVVTFSCSRARPVTSPQKKAALATSSSTEGPDGRTRFSIRKWARPS